ncbi:subtilisin-like protein [Lactarius quietus]|nr:subtilisin-like protein [Lactarius quietus]
MHYYHWLSVLSFLSSVPIANLGIPPALIWGDRRVKHTWGNVPANWESLGSPPDGSTIDLYLALKPHHESALIDELHEVSNPKHPKYGSHLSKEQVAKLVAPRQDTEELVHSWLEHHGVPPSSISRTHGGCWLTVTSVPVSQADELLNASYQIYKHTETNEMIIRTVSYALPEALHAHVQTVAPTTVFAFPHSLLQTPIKLSSEEASVMANGSSEELLDVLSRRGDPTVDPDVLRSLYKTEAYVPTGLGPNKLGILGLQNDFPSQADLTQFMTRYRAEARAATFTVVPVNRDGYDDLSSPTAEASVDIQYSGAMIYPTPQIFYSTAGPIQWTRNGSPAPGEAYLVWLKYLLDLPNIPPTISISYANPEPTLPLIYATVLCNLFAQLGLRGVSVLVATGDDGVGSGDCLDNSGNFIPMFPATCPWVTSVGGTMNLDPEIAMYLSGGGFSQHFPRPNYQDRAVFNFLQNLGDEYAGLFKCVRCRDSIRPFILCNFFSARGRGIPDISSQARRFKFFLNSKHYVVSGTSCSTPTVAGIVSLLNDFMISTGRPPLGFLNFRLYGQAREGLTDITSGTNPGCNTNGFSAVAGWDPVTGLGTPNFERLQQIFDNLMARPVHSTSSLN